jgi:hypothetical protein
MNFIKLLTVKVALLVSLSGLAMPSYCYNDYSTYALPKKDYSSDIGIFCLLVITGVVLHEALKELDKYVGDKKIDHENRIINQFENLPLLKYHQEIDVLESEIINTARLSQEDIAKSINSIKEETLLNLANNITKKLNVNNFNTELKLTVKILENHKAKVEGSLSSKDKTDLNFKVFKNHQSLLNKKINELNILSLCINKHLDYFKLYKTLTSLEINYNLELNEIEVNNDIDKNKIQQIIRLKLYNDKDFVQKYLITLNNNIEALNDSINEIKHPYAQILIKSKNISAKLLLIRNIFKN